MPAAKEEKKRAAGREKKKSNCAGNASGTSEFDFRYKNANLSNHSLLWTDIRVGKREENRKGRQKKSRRPNEEKYREKQLWKLLFEENEVFVGVER